MVDEYEYERLKQIGVDKFLKNNKKDILTRDKAIRDRLIRFIYENMDLTQEKIAEIAGISRRTVISSLKIDQNDEINHNYSEISDR